MYIVYPTNSKLPTYCVYYAARSIGTQYTIDEHGYAYPLGDIPLDYMRDNGSIFGVFIKNRTWVCTIGWLVLL